ncbi:hypothetical protein T266_08105 [Pseudomonas aeruginosa VRFPA05]|nr:hypothetical protein T266_08105 [Pseudomonas aeruginosa VRFPA05]
MRAYQRRHAFARFVAQAQGFRADRHLLRAGLAEQATGLFGVEQVVVADEAGGEGVFRRGVEGLRVAALDDASGVHQDDAVGQGQRFFLIMGDEHRGQPQLLLDAADLFAQVLADARVEGRQRLVEQQQARARHQRAGQRHALALAAGELVRVACGVLAQFHQFDGFGDPLLQFRRRHLLHAQAEGDVLLHGHVGEQRVALEHHGDPALLRRQRHHILAVDEDAPAVDLGQPGDAAQQGGLAAAAGAEQGDELAAGGGEVDIAEDAGGTVALVELFDADERHDQALSLFSRLAAQVRTRTNTK